MIIERVVSVLLFIILIVQCSGKDFTSSPGKVKRDPGSKAVVTWTLSRLFNPKTYLAAVYVYRNNIKIITYQYPHTPCDTKGDSRLDCILPKTTGFTVGFSITSVRDTDAGNYSIEVIHNVDANHKRNENGFVYVFRSPIVQVSGDHETTEGNNITLTCRATSQSLPVSLRYTAKMLYNWNINNPDGNHVVYGNRVTIQTSNKRNQGATFLCVVKEDGSSLTGSDTVILNIFYAPGKPRVTGIPTQVLIEDRNRLSVTCQLSGDDLGNPSVNHYVWRNVNSSYSRDTGSNNKLILFSINAKQHDGIWQCQPENSVGQGQLTQFKVTVNTQPSVIKDLPRSFDIINTDSLSFTCSIKAKPAASITWIYEDKNKLPEAVTYTENHVIIDRVYTLTTSTLTWNHQAALGDPRRRQAGGRYRCHAVNTVGYRDSNNMELNLLYEYMFCEQPPTEEDVDLKSNMTISFCLSANPFTEITSNNWTFSSNNGSVMISGLPDGVLLSIQDTSHPYEKYAKLIIPAVNKNHYGVYTLKVKNNYNTKAVTHVFKLLPEGNTDNGLPLPAIIGGLLTVLVLTGIVVIIIVLHRKGILPKAKSINSKVRRHRRQKQKSTQTYETAGLSTTQQSEISSVYQKLGEAKLTVFSNSDVILESVIASGDFYNVWKGKLKSNDNLKLDVVIKTIKDPHVIYTRYLSEQGEAMCKLRSSDYVLACYGISQDKKYLLMENSSTGDLQQFLREKSENSYYNVGNDQDLPKLMNFIHQIIRGVKSVFELQPPALFYCLSASNVLITNQQQCKLTGFATSTAVNEREKWEEEHNLPRPVRWLSPEAIKLNHIKESDIWSLGVLLWEITNEGQQPLADKSDVEAKQLILRGQRYFKAINCSDELYDLMCACWFQQPHKRPTIYDVESQLLEITQYETV